MLTPDWLADGPVREVLTRLETQGFAAFAVGGCVRNALLELPVNDFDITTSARPDAVTDLFETDFRVVPTGLDHGTVTVVISDVPVEITTFRTDVESDGRRARVAFSENIEDDAARRDFTMNALYLDLRGNVHDPVGGLADLSARRVRFIGDASKRIEEDYLRALRFFRFHAQYGNDEGGLDPDALAAIASHLDGIPGLSLERVTSELLKTLAAPEPSMAVAGMESCGLLQLIVPGATTKAFFEYLHLEHRFGGDVDVIARFAALGGQPKLRLSRKQAHHLHLLSRQVQSETTIPEVAYRHGADVAQSVALLRAAGTSQPLAPDVSDVISHAAAAQFPLSASDLMPDLQGEALGTALENAENAWIASGFSLGQDDLLSIARSRG